MESTSQARSLRDRLLTGAGTFVLLTLIILFAGYLRYQGGVVNMVNNWVHPDANRLVIANGDVDFRGIRWEMLTPGFIWRNGIQQSAVESIDPHFFAYGSFPIYLYDLIELWSNNARREGRWSFITQHMVGIYEVGRFTSSTLGILTVLMTFLLGWRTYGSRKVGLLAALFLAVTTLHIQLSHYLTVDVTLTFLTSVSLFFVAGVMLKGSWFSYFGAGIAIGLTLATKANGLLLLPMLVMAHAGYLIRTQRILSIWSAKQWVALGLAGAIGAGTYFVAMPFGYFKYDEMTRAVQQETRFVRGENMPVFMIQYNNTPRFLYQTRHLFHWSFGPALGLLVIGGFVFASFDLIRYFSYDKLIPVVFGYLYFLLVGNLQVKWLRHLLPAYPAFCIFAAVLAVWLMTRLPEWWMRYAGTVFVGLVIAFTSLWALAYLNIYFDLNPRNKSSRWIYQNIEQGSRILREHWDETQPIADAGFSPAMYETANLGIYDHDQSRPGEINDRKARRFADELARSDAIVIGSRRLYGATLRNPDRFPLMNRYYRLLFSGELGYTLVHTATTYPSIFGLEVVDDLADESFTVYDHPKSLVFKNTGQLTADQIFDKLERPSPEVMDMTWEEVMLFDLPEHQEYLFRIGDFIVRRHIDEPDYENMRRDVRPNRARRRNITAPTPVPEDAVFTMYEGGMGVQRGRFNEPRDIALAPDGSFYVADFRNNRIQKFSAQGAFELTFGSEGNDIGQLKDPSGIAVGPDGTVYVSDTWNHRVQVFDADGSNPRIKQMRTSLYAPAGVTVDAENQLYVADAGSRRLVRVAPDGLVKGVYHNLDPGNALGEVFDVAVDSRGQVWTGDSDAREVVVFSADSKLLHQIPLPNADLGRKQIYLEATDRNTVLVSDAKSATLFEFDLEGREVGRHQDRQQFNSQTGLVADANHVYVVNTLGNRVIRIPWERFVAPNAEPQE